MLNLCHNCNHECSGNPLDHVGPCERDGKHYCSTFCSMRDGERGCCGTYDPRTMVVQALGLVKRLGKLSTEGIEEFFRIGYEEVSTRMVELRAERDAFASAPVVLEPCNSYSRKLYHEDICQHCERLASEHKENPNPNKI